MPEKFFCRILFLAAVFFVWTSCSTQKNTAVTRWYHSVNSRYNIHYNAQLAYDEALNSKSETNKDDLTDMLNVFASDPAASEKTTEGGSFNKVIDKCVKAIKLHSIQKKPMKDANKRNDEKYQNWYKQREFNPFLKISWLLLAKSEFQNNDYLKSLSTFTYITRLFATHPEVVVEARIWMMRIYGEMGWLYEAEDALKKIELAGAVPNSLEGDFAAAKANLFLRQKRYAEAIPFLITAADKGETHRERTRLKFLLGQVYEKTGNKHLAYKTYGEIGGLNTPYIYELSAQLKQAENTDERGYSAALLKLDDMAGGKRNKEYLDQVYLVKGNLYMSRLDTLHAISSYEKAVEKSTRKGSEKVKAQIILGDLYFEKRQYIKAQPHYSEAIGGLKKEHEAYERVALRSKVLEVLAQHENTIVLQDSLQTLARMPEKERLVVIDKIIADLIKAEKEKKLLAEKQKAENNAPNRSGGGQRTVDIPLSPNTQGGFYYDNEQSILQGKNSFAKKWGNRKLEDNWRRGNKTVLAFADASTTPEPVKDSLKSESKSAVVEVSDKHKREYYLQQLPFTKEQVVKSDSIIDDAMFQMAEIYHRELSDLPLAVETYEKELKLFASTPNKEEIYFRLYMLYHDWGKKALAESYRQKMLATFPNSNYSKSFSDPDYEWNLRNPRALQDSLYAAAYDAYLKSDVNTVRKKYTDIQSKYPQSDLMPKMLLLNALTYAQTKEEGKFRELIKEILEKYPQSDVVSLATDMLKESLAGKSLTGGDPIRGIVWNTSSEKNAGGLVQADSTLNFKVNDPSEHFLLLIYPLKKTNKNDLLYTIADYNFSHYVLSTFDMIFDDRPPMGVLQIKGFSSFRNLKHYVEDATKNNLFSKLDEEILPVPISAENYDILQSGKTLDEYMDFFNRNYTKILPQMTTLWTARQQAKKDKTASENTPQIPQPQTPPVETQAETPSVEVKSDTLVRKDIDISRIRAKSLTSGHKSSIEDKNKPEEDGLKDAVEMVDKSLKTIKQLSENPLEGIKNAIHSLRNRPKLSKEEKAEQKRVEEAEKAEKARLEKLERERQKTLKDSVSMVRKMEKSEKERVEKEKQEQLQAIENQKIADKKAKEEARKAKEEARKKREEELKEKAKKREEELKEKEKVRTEKLKAREKELNEQRKQRERERKGKS